MEKVVFQQNIPLADYTTFKIGGPAQYFFVAKIKQDLIKAIQKAKQENLPFFVLGGGSNLLVADEGYEGLVIKIQMSKSKCQINDKCQMSKIYTEAGAKLEELVKLSAEQGLSGLEWAAGIPEATVGGAIKVNASAFEKSMKDIVKETETFEGIILSAVLELKRKNKGEVQKEIDYVLNYRETNHPMNLPSAGCIFKNPPHHFSQKSGGGPAAQLIEKCGLKGKTIGQAQISKKHANFIVNLGGAKAQDALALIKLAKQKVKEKFNIELKEEIQYVGFK